MKAGITCLRGVETSSYSGLSCEACPKTGFFVFQTCFAWPVSLGFLIRANAERFRKKALPPYELGGSGACPKPRGLKAIAIACKRFSNSQLTRGMSFGGIASCQGSKMLLGGFVVLFLGLAFFFFVLPQGLCASPAIMPTTACVALASLEETISTISSEKSRASALRRTLALAPSLFSTQKIASPSLGLSGYVVIGTTNPVAKLHLSGGDPNNIFSNATIALGYTTTGLYPNFIHTRHNGSTAVGNAIDFYTGDGTAAGVYPTNAVLGMTITNGSVGMGFTSPFSAPPIAAIADATQPAFPNLSWQEKRNRNPAHGMASTAAARDFDDHSRASPYRKAA
jgi:hypothetical protein